MKFTIKYYCLFALIVLFATTSCEKWLSVSPRSEVKYDDLFKDKEGFRDQLTGIYTAMCEESLYGANLTYGMLDALGQQYTWIMEVGDYYYLHKFEYNNTISTSIISTIWSRMYNTIANINILIHGLNEFPNVLSVEEREIYLGEAYGLRAYLHFDLLRLFGPSYKSGSDKKAIPYIKSISKNVTPMSSVTQILDLVIEDLLEAKKYLAKDPIISGEEISQFIGNRIFHLNYYAVEAMLARVYMYKNDKQNAYKTAKEVLNANKFNWIARECVTTPLREARDGIFSTETIFALNNMKLDALTGKYLREGMSDSKDNLLIIKPEVLDQIYESDLYGGYDWRYIYYFEVQRETYKGSSKLWQYRTMPDEYRNKQPLLRMSELYLILAECAENKEEAISYFNTLREHRGFDASFNLDASTNDTAFISEIAKEYRKEFIGEGQWFFYCKRNDLDELPNVTVPFSKGYYILPLPDLEIEYGNRN
jgi:SusD family.